MASSTLPAVVVVAAGRGTRALGAGMPKQFAPLGGLPVLARTLKAFADHPAIGAILAVIHPSDDDLYRSAVATLPAGRLLPPAAGGATRQASVAAGLEALAALRPPAVLIHDAARPFLSGPVIDRVLAELQRRPGAIPALAVVDTLKRVGSDGLIAGTADRSGLFRAQTPQGFHFDAILEAHRRARAAGRDDFTDDAALAEWAGMPVAIVEGDADNTKLTTRDDFASAERSVAAALGDVRTGFGFDVHRFGPGDHVMLCGVCVAHDRGVIGHSDADVALHALTDAVLGAIGAGDIGDHFPPTEERWGGAPSRIFLAEAARLLAARGGLICHTDVTVLCEKPRIAAYREAMRASIAVILSVPVGRTSVKATTTEGLGFIGRGEGLAAQAVATVRLPLS